jgi:hypothetical protein
VSGRSFCAPCLKQRDRETNARLNVNHESFFPRYREKPPSRRSSQPGQGSALRQRAYSYCRFRHSAFLPRSEAPPGAPEEKRPDA